jgi:hypothetical protein
VLAVAGSVELRVHELMSDRFSIGRRPACDLVLDDPSVSLEHARIVVRDGVSMLQDLHRRERTRVNGWPVRLRELVTGDLIDIGVFRLRYETVDPGDRSGQGPQAGSATRPSQDDAIEACIVFMAGPRTGECQSLDREKTIVDDGSGHLVMIARRNGAHAVTHIEGLHPTGVNGRPLSGGPCLLVDGDRVVAGGLVMRYQRKG